MKKSAGVLLFRRVDAELLVLLAHPGGPFYRNKDLGAWTIPKGELDDTEDPLACAVRELREETGISVAPSALLPLGAIKQKGGKRVWAFAAAADTELVLAELPPSNTFELEWPPRSGKRESFPEIDQLAFFSLAEARQKLSSAQAELLDRLEAALLSADAQVDK